MPIGPELVKESRELQKQNRAAAAAAFALRQFSLWKEMIASAKFIV